MANDFYLRYYTGHVGRYGNEFLEFELSEGGLLRYANNSKSVMDHGALAALHCSGWADFWIFNNHAYSYRSDSLIRKESK